jgi:hypothetical protein
MVAIVCLRIAAGLIGSVVILDPGPIPPRFFRVQHLAALALTAVAAFFLSDVATPGLWIAVIVALTLCFAGSVVWHLNAAPGGTAINLLAAMALLGCLIVADLSMDVSGFETTPLLDDVVSAAVLGTATSAMLMGHSYLIAPAMTMTPLLRLLAAFALALAARIILACLGLYQWTRADGHVNLETETLAWLVARWLVGFVAPIVLGWLAWETARIRSTQSATGILYVVVIVVFLGELTSLLLVEKTRFLL